MPATPRAASNGPSMVCGPCRLRRVTTLALVPAASQAMRSIAAVISSDVFGLTTRMVGLSIPWALQDLQCCVNDGENCNPKPHLRHAETLEHGLKYGYALVSTDDQTPPLQLSTLKKAGCKTIFKDEGISGATVKRPALSRCLKTLRPGDTLIVWKLDRLGHSLRATIYRRVTAH